MSAEAERKAAEEIEKASWRIAAELYPELCTGLSDDLVEFHLKAKVIAEGITQSLARAQSELVECRKELEAAKHSEDIAHRDAGLYCGTLRMAAHQLGCDDCMVDHAVKDMLKQLADHRAGMARALEALKFYAEKANWSKESEATTGGEEETTIYLSEETLLASNEPGWIVAETAIAELARLLGEQMEEGK